MRKSNYAAENLRRSTWRTKKNNTHSPSSGILAWSEISYHWCCCWSCDLILRLRCNLFHEDSLSLPPICLSLQQQEELSWTKMPTEKNRWNVCLLSKRKRRLLEIALPSLHSSRYERARLMKRLKIAPQIINNNNRKISHFVWGGLMTEECSKAQT